MPHTRFGGTAAKLSISEATAAQPDARHKASMLQVSQPPQPHKGAQQKLHNAHDGEGSSEESVSDPNRPAADDLADSRRDKPHLQTLAQSLPSPSQQGHPGSKTKIDAAPVGIKAASANTASNPSSSPEAFRVDQKAAQIMGPTGVTLPAKLVEPRLRQDVAATSKQAPRQRQDGPRPDSWRYITASVLKPSCNLCTCS